MFGYIKPQTSELKVRESIFYRSIYCGLCRSLSNHTGGLSITTLSYDMTFFAIVRMILKEEEYKIKKRRCFLHPFRTSPMMVDSNELTYSSYVSVVLSHEKVRDNIHDEKFFKRLFYYLIYPFTATFKNRNKIKFINEVSTKYLNEILELEKNKCSKPDELANAFGGLVAELLKYDLDEQKARIAENIGIHLGRYIYLSDAICDYKSDVKNNKYNPFIYSFSNDDERQTFLSEGYKIVLQREINEIIASLNLICNNKTDELNACAYNIVELGMNHHLQLKLKNQKEERIYGK